jgi:hypothetical protein
LYFKSFFCSAPFSLVVVIGRPLGILPDGIERAHQQRNNSESENKLSYGSDSDLS